MADFLDSEADESDNSENEELDQHERKRLKKLKAMSDSEEEDEEDDEDRLREELKDLIDDNPIDEDGDDDDDDSDGSGGEKRKKSDDEDELDDRLEDDDYDLIEENLGVKVQRTKKFKRLKRMQIDDSDGEDADEGMDRDVIANQLFDGDDDHDQDDDSRRSIGGHRATNDVEQFDEEEEEEESDADDFIVDDDGRPITDKKKRTRRIFNDAHLQEGQDIFGVDFDYDEFEKYDDDEYEDESEAEDEYEEEGVDGEREKRPKKSTRKKTSRKSIFEIYEPSELKRGHFTDLDNEIRKTDIPERMQLREIPITSVPEGSNELEEEAEWIYNQCFIKRTISTQETNSANAAAAAVAAAATSATINTPAVTVTTNNTEDDDWDDAPAAPAPPVAAVPSNPQTSTINKIKQALDFMRNQQLEVPFIAFYRKEYVQPELNINDLWKIYKFDIKWCQLVARKRSLLQLFEKMRNYQLDKIMLNPDKDLAEDIRLMKDEDIERLKYAQTPEELKDVHTHFLLHYSHEIQGMQDAWRAKEKAQRREQRRRERRKLMEESLEDGAQLPNEILDDEVNGGDNEDDDDDDDEEEAARQDEKIKYARDSGPYAMCRKAGILGLATRFGLTPEEFAENLRDNYQRHDVDQESIEPTELAKEYINKKFKTVEEVLEAAKFVVARQIAREPLLRKSVREIFYERAKLSIYPTKKGQKEVDENHPCFSMKYVKNKPVSELSSEQFLRLSMAEEDKLLTIVISERIDGNTSNSSYLDDVKALYQRDEFSKNVQDWNALRASCVEEALNKMVLPDMRKELRSILLNESKEAVLRACCLKLYNWIKLAPPVVNFQEEDDSDWDTSRGLRVMGLAYIPDFSQAAFCCIVNIDGEVTDYLKLPNILKRRNTIRPEDKSMKEADLLALKTFIRHKKPHFITIGGESREASMIQDELREIMKELTDEDQFPNVSVEIIDNELAKIYSNSKKGLSDFRDYPILLRQAISLARRIQDPLIEFSQLCTTDDEILCLRYHTLQDQLTKEELLESLQLEFINRTNEVGVDINLAVQNALTVNLVQFICGLGPRKGQALIKLLKQTNQRLENRTQLVTSCHMGPKVFINCSGFIKIDTNSLGDSTEAYVEVLDGSRVHPETYEWARKMAVDALEYDDEDANPAGALEEILESPERLKDLDLDAFAVELERQGFGNKSITLYDIRAELNSRYKDLRIPTQPLTAEELFDVLTKETPESLYVGKMVLATVIGITHRKPQGEQLDQANPIRDDETGLWQCPFCLCNDFPELSEVWNHFDAGACPGQATGIRVRLDNGLMGFIHIKNLSDKHVKNPEERVQIGQTIHVRVTKIDVERFAVDCTSKTSDLLDRNNEWRPRKDDHYDQETEDKDTKREDDVNKNKSRQQYTKRIIIHPAFHNKSYGEAVKIMETMDQGEVIVRPSSKGSDHLTVTWKVADEIYQHIDVREEGKENVFSLGQTLWIGNEEFEALDEIIARHVNPMAAYARDLLTYKYYRDAAGGMRDKMEEFLKEEKKKNPNKIHYFMSASKSYPGKFLLSYMPSSKIKHEYVTVTPEGFRFRQQIFESLNSLLKWFKEHFRDPLPVGGSVSLSINTPHDSLTGSARTSYTTPLMSGNSSADITNNKTGSLTNLPSSGYMNNNLSSSGSVASGGGPGSIGGQTPHTPGYGYINTPYTPSGQTPFMTPYHTPHHTPHQSPHSTPRHQTPRYAGHTTPSPHITPTGSFISPSPINNGQFVHPGQRGNKAMQMPHSSSSMSMAGHHQRSNKPQNQQYHHHHHHHPNQYQQPSPNSFRSPHAMQSPHNRGGAYTSLQRENMDWQKASEAWASKSRRDGGGSGGSNSGTPRDNIGHITPRGSNHTPRYDEPNVHKTPQYDDLHNMRQTNKINRDYQQAHHQYSSKSPRSVRSTPRTNTSPHSMTPGDATPLYDEN